MSLIKDLSFIFQKKILLEPEWYLFQQQNNNQRCLGVISLAGYEGTTVGDVFLQAYTTMYDIANLQVGWAPVVAKNCI